MLNQKWIVWGSGFSAQNPPSSSEDETDSLFPKGAYFEQNTDYFGARCLSRCEPPQPPTPAPSNDPEHNNMDTEIDDILDLKLAVADLYYDDVQSEDETGSWQAIPTADTVREACHQLLREIESDRSKLAAGRVYSDMFAELIHLGTTALRSDHTGAQSYHDDDLNHCVLSAQRAAPALLKATRLGRDRAVDELLSLLQSPFKLHALLTLHDHTNLLSILVMCTRNLMLSLVLPSRSPSPAHMAVRSEVLLESSLHLVGAINAV